MQTVALDFDGVIHSYHSGWLDGSIYGGFIPGAPGALMTLMSRYPVFILTSRDPGQVARWLESQLGIVCTTAVPASGFWDEMGVLLVTNRKLPASAYVDDRAVKFTNWSQAAADLDYAILAGVRSPA